ncbi:MAG: HepT-like ribonuclease domain-containing protein [Patescibacteria group bacterium]
MLNKDLIKRKISLIQDDLIHMADFKDATFEEVTTNYGKQAIIERLMERIINRAIDINQHLIAELGKEDSSGPKDYKNTFTLLVKFSIYPEEFGQEISKSIGTRNKLVHEYDNVNQQAIYNSIKDCLIDYQQYCDFILKFIDKVSE